MANSIGKVFSISTWGESHGSALGVLIDGCPPLLSIDAAEIELDLKRRKPGQSKLTSPRKEPDRVEILSGVFEGKTTGTPISLIVYNEDQRSQDYRELAEIYRPGHADFSYDCKYRIRDHRGGGRSSARVTIAHVAAGAIARKILREELAIEIVAYVKQVLDIRTKIEPAKVCREMVESNPMRCPDREKAEQMMQLIKKLAKEGDSAGGIVECIVRNVPPGLGQPIFDKLHADLAKAMMSINAARGFEIGSGFDCALMQGSEHNDSFINNDGKIMLQTNHCGGILGGISTGSPIEFRIAFKPTPTIAKEQNTVTCSGKPITFRGKGRHDPCVLPRAVAIVEAMAALVICDHWLRRKIEIT